MSIVQEALKKAQAYIEERRAPSPKEPIEEKAERRVHSEKRLPLPGVVALTLLIALISLSIFAVTRFTLERKSKLQGSTKTVLDSAITHQEIAYKSAAPVVGPEPAKESTRPVQDLKAPLAIAPQYPKLVLNGIMHLKGVPQAIINNSIVEEGDMVSGAKVLKISENSVTLNFNDVEIALTLKK